MGKPKEQTPAQFIADLLCKRMGKKKDIPTPPGYWSMPEWKVEYKKKILEANKFLKVYPLTVIIAVLNDKKLTWVYSLYSPAIKQPLEFEMEKHLRGIVREEHLKEKERIAAQTEFVNTESAPIILESGEKSLKNRLD